VNRQTIFEGLSNFQIFYISLRPSNRLLPGLNIILELEQWTNRKQEFIQLTNGNNEDCQVVWQPIPLHIISSMCFHLNCVDSGKNNSSSESHCQNSQANRGCYLHSPRMVHFVKNSISWASPFKKGSPQTTWSVPSSILFDGYPVYLMPESFIRPDLSHLLHYLLNIYTQKYVAL
jgi:hypothetical protein